MGKAPIEKKKKSEERNAQEEREQTGSSE